MIASGLHFRNARIPQTRKPIASTPFVLNLHRGIGGYDFGSVTSGYVGKVDYRWNGFRGKSERVLKSPLKWWFI